MSSGGSSCHESTLASDGVRADSQKLMLGQIAFVFQAPLGFCALGSRLV